MSSVTHLLDAAAEAMRRILVEAARRKGRLRHGGGPRRVDLDAATVPPDDPADDLLALDETLTALAEAEPDKAALAQLRYFAGLTLEQAACRGISLATAKRPWTAARAWLYDALTGEPPENPSNP